jgi:hypothetical protein
MRRRRQLALATAVKVAAISIYGQGGDGLHAGVAGQPMPSPSPSPIQNSGSSTIIRRKKMKRRSSTKQRSASSASASFPAQVSSISAASKNEATLRDVQQASTTSHAGNEDGKIGDSRTASSTLSERPDRPNKCMDPFLASTTPWVRRYLASTADDVLLPVPREFLADGFNLQGLQQCVERIGQRVAARASSSSNGEVVATHTSEPGGATKKQPLFPLYRAALTLILSKKEERENDEHVDTGVAAAAEALYVLVHARFCVSPRGLDTLRRLLSTRYQSKSTRRDGCNEPVFGRCPRIGCDGMHLLPCGMSDEYSDSDDDNISSNRKAMRYCISCGEMLMPSKPSKVDGSAWGTSLCHLLIMTYGVDMFPEHFGGDNRNNQDSDFGMSGESKSIGGYSPVPQVFGFPVHPTKAAIKYPLLLQPDK